jgi:hypothetical protein
MRRTLSLLVAAMLVALMPVGASAQEIEFETELGDVGTAIDGLVGESAEEWEASLGEVTAAVDVLKGIAADLDYAELDAAIADLETAIAGGDLAEIAAAAEALEPAFVALEAQVPDDDDTAEPTAVDTGSGVDQGPNLGLLGVAGLLALLATGAWALRPASSRR